MVEGREALWQRLDGLVHRAGSRGLEALTDQEVEDLGRLYRAAANHLALLRGFGGSARSREELNSLVSRAHAVVYGRAPIAGRRALLPWTFGAFAVTVRRTLAYHAVALALLLAGMLYGFAGAGRDPEWALGIVPAADERTPYASREELRKSLLAGREGGDTVEDPQKAFFAAILWRHNTQVALLAFFAGFLAGIPTALLLFFNGVVLGVYSHAFVAHGLAWQWWAWILPHGITELLAIVLLGGGGLWIGHLILAPGGRSRADALAFARGDIARLLVLAFPMLLLAALIESFVRQSGLSDGARYGFAAATALFWALFFAFARPSRRVLASLEGERTVAARAVSLPMDEDLLAFLGRRS